MASSTTDRRLGLTGGTAMKAPCKAATTANITLSGEQTVDGISCVTGDRILVKNQTTGADNGIYVVDTGSWTRDLDFDGSYDVRSGTVVRVNQGSTNGVGIFYISTADPITIGTTSLTFTRDSVNYVTSSSQTASAGQTLFNLGSSYQAGSGALAVYVNGLRSRLTADYTETSSTSITFTYALQAGDEVDVYIGTELGNVTAALASGVSLADSGDYYIGTTVEAVFQEIASAINADVGDSSATLTYGSSSKVQRWNTALTGNKTVTLSTSNAKEGAQFIIVRASGATGNYTLTVGSLATLRAPGEWCVVGYDSGTAAWVLLSYGILPSAEIMAMSADNGDAAATLTVGTSEVTQRWATALTADRTASLSATGAYTGARFRIIRTETATGSFSLVVAGTAILTRLACGQWCDVEYSGSAWLVVANGNLRNPNTNVISIYDDFLGEEINGYIWQSLIGSDSSCLQAVVRSEQLRGMARLVTGAGAAATMAVNGVLLNSRLNWEADQGGLVCEFRLMMDAITSVAVFIGLTDQDSSIEIPINGAGGGDTFTNNATDAVGVLFDTTMTTTDWWLVGVAGGVGATGQDSAVAPTASTMETWRIELSSIGTATFYRNGTLVGSSMTGAVTSTVPLTPVVAAFSRTGASRNIDIDYVFIQAQR